MLSERLRRSEGTLILSLPPPHNEIPERSVTARQELARTAFSRSYPGGFRLVRDRWELSCTGRHERVHFVPWICPEEE
jgi:hypothetical protein